MEYLPQIIAIVVSTVAGWIMAARMRRRMREALRRDVLDGELTSIATWMKVEEVEGQHKMEQRG
jgi:sensor domain CHASE-containing protein